MVAGPVVPSAEFNFDLSTGLFVVLARRREPRQPGRMTATFPFAPDRPVSLAQVHADGISLRQWRKPDLQRVTPGVRRLSPPATVRDKALAFDLAIGYPYAFSHLTSWCLHDLPLPDVYGSYWTLDVMRPTADGRCERAGCRGRRGLEIREVVKRRGLPLVGIADTWVDLGELQRPALTREDLIIAGDAAVLALERLVIKAEEGTPEFEEELAQMSAARWEQEHGLGPGPQVPDGRALLREALAGRTRPRGARLLADAVGQVRSRVRSPMETRARLRIVEDGIEEPETGCEVPVATGWVGEFDLGWRDQKVLAEYQGAPHGTLQSREADRNKRQLVEDEDWEVIEIYARDIYQPGPRADLMRRIRAALNR